ncbi:MAG: dihydrofolate reductase [Candidatus Gracilibacteria bacterium]|jgi:dihydrofolate reductase
MSHHRKDKYIIVAIDENNGIGIGNQLPWRLKKDMQYFKERTTHVHDPEKENAVIMGRKTWESLPESSRPLPNRMNIVLTSKNDYEAKDATICGSIEEAIRLCEENDYVEKIFFIGGAEVFTQSLEYTDGLYVTQIKKDFKCDKFFPEIPEYFDDVKKLGEMEESGISYDFLLYKKSEI